MSIHIIAEMITIFALLAGFLITLFLYVKTTQKLFKVSVLLMELATRLSLVKLGESEDGLKVSRLLSARDLARLNKVGGGISADGSKTKKATLKEEGTATKKEDKPGLTLIERA